MLNKILFFPLRKIILVKTFLRYLHSSLIAILAMGLMFVNVAQSECHFMSGKYTFAIDPYIELYENTNFRGNWVGCGTGEIGQMNDINISSIKIDISYKLIAFDRENFKGNSKVYEAGNHQDLGNWNNRIRSIIIESENTTNRSSHRQTLAGRWILNVEGARNQILLEFEPSGNGGENYRVSCLGRAGGEVLNPVAEGNATMNGRQLRFYLDGTQRGGRMEGSVYAENRKFLEGKCFFDSRNSMDTEKRCWLEKY